MSIEAKFENPICIKLGKNSNIILADKDCEEDYPLSPGVMFGKEHYGFILITDVNGRQREEIYPTQCKIQAIGIEGNVLKIFEAGKKFSWTFDKLGTLEHSVFDEFSDEFQSQINTIIENSTILGGAPVIKNPLYIKISKNPKESVILKDENSDKDYPLHPRAIIGTVHYGFILIIDTNDGQKEVICPTQNRIDAVGIEGNYDGDLKIFENGKYHPWLFTYDGKFKQQSSYNPYSRMDKQFVGECYNLNESSSKDCFTLAKKK